MSIPHEGINVSPGESLTLRIDHLRVFIDELSDLTASSVRVGCDEVDNLPGAVAELEHELRVTENGVLLANDTGLMGLCDVHHIEVPGHDVPLVLRGFVVEIVVVANADVDVSKQAIERAHGVVSRHVHVVPPPLFGLGTVGGRVEG